MNRSSNQLRQATMGGVIAVTNKDGGTKLFGITAGHFLLQESCLGRPVELSDSFTEDHLSSEEDSYELDPSLFECNAEEKYRPSGRDGDMPGVVGALVNWSRVGNLSAASHTKLEDRPNLD